MEPLEAVLVSSGAFPHDLRWALINLHMANGGLPAHVLPSYSIHIY